MLKSALSKRRSIEAQDGGSAGSTPRGDILSESTRSVRIMDGEATGRSSSDNSGRGTPMKLKERIENSNLMTMVSLSRSLKTLRNMVDDIEIPESCLQELKLLGKGGFGSVYLCQYNTGEKAANVAVKRINQELLTSKTDLDLFMKECMLLKKLSHRNIVDFIGMGPPPTVAADVSPTGECVHTTFLVQEFCDSGSLQDMLNKQMSTGSTKLKSYTTCDALEWLIDIAQGLKYLHESSPSVIHRDMKLENMFLSKCGGRLQVKLGDFGLSAICDKKEERRKKMRTEYESASPDDNERLGSFTSAATSVFKKVTSKVKRQDSQGGATDPEGPDPSNPSNHSGNSALERVESYRKADRPSQLVRKATLDALKLGSVFGPTLTRSHTFDRMKFNLTGQTGSLMYMAPEVTHGEPYNEKVDVFALGVMTFELFMGFSAVCLVSHAGMPQELQSHANRTATGHRLSIPKSWPPEVKAAINGFWAQRADDRPSAHEALRILRGLRPVVEEWMLSSSQPGCFACLSPENPHHDRRFLHGRPSTYPTSRHAATIV